MTNPQKYIEEAIERLKVSEPYREMEGILTTAILTGRASQYYGKTIQDVFAEELLTMHQRTVEESEGDYDDGVTQVLNASFGYLGDVKGFSPEEIMAYGEYVHGKLEEYKEE